MYLTERKTTGTAREEDNHQEVEMLLESYHKICDEIVEISGLLISNIRNTEEVVKAILDANRNQLMLLEIKFSVGTLGLAGGTLVAGLYGMNLKNFIEESDLAFGGSAPSVLVCPPSSACMACASYERSRKSVCGARASTSSGGNPEPVGEAIGEMRRSRAKRSVALA